MSNVKINTLGDAENLGKNWLGHLLMAQRAYLWSMLVLSSQTRLEFE